ncbi:hypothetical protein [Bacillus manliponensis]|uniref:hypothetical protein n=1 Tax=Bacillus manliponensis TaxID=574376 RepID=UPI0035141021
MKRVWRIVTVLVFMVIATYGLTKIFVYYANKPVGTAAIPKTEKVVETEEVLQFIRMTHESYNNFLNYGKSENYTDGDWNQLSRWFQQQEGALQTIDKKVKNKKIKRDVKRSYEIMKKGMVNRNIEYVVYAHRIYHDLDIFVNDYTGETNIWGYTEFGNGKDMKVVEEALKTE